MKEYIENRKEIIRQYWEIKRKHPDAVLLFRNGDFYEAVYDDARDLSKILDLNLVQSEELGKDKVHSLVGFPHHSLDMYLPKIVRADRRVAICEQLENPKL